MIKIKVLLLVVSLKLTSTSTSWALENGLAIKPPMGWRSWNCFKGSVTDSIIREVIDAIIKQRPIIATSFSPSSRRSTTRRSNFTVSLNDLGYNRVGVDDGWQDCGAGNKESFHSSDGTPLLNLSSFPNDLKQLVDYGHSKKLLMDWYLLNCICMDTYTLIENQTWADLSWSRNVNQLYESRFDGVKIDNCGDDSGLGYETMVKLINKRIGKNKKPLLIENSNQGHGQGPPRGLPNRTVSGNNWCNFNMFRTGGDIGPEFSNVMNKLQTTIPFLSKVNPISRPSCWAYPDMLQVGNFESNKYFVESRTHFGAWCIVSSPLILGLDVRDDAKVNSVWEIISNVEAINVNQVWFGHPGRLVKEVEMTNNGNNSIQIWAKKVSNKGSQAVLVINRGDNDIIDQNITFTMNEIDIDINTVNITYVRDIWNHKHIGPSIIDNDDDGRVTIHPVLKSHDSVFYRFDVY